MSTTKEELEQLSNQIKNEQAQGKNTANRVGDLFGKIVDYFSSSSSVDSGRYEFRYKNSTTEPSVPATGTPGTSDGWSSEATTPDYEHGEYTWMTQCFCNAAGIYGTWNRAIRITGDNGKSGEDGKDIEFIYTRNNTGVRPDTPSSVQQEDYVPEGWTDNPAGVSATMQYEYISNRIKENGIWSDFCQPALWSKWGEKGQDGDGYEYIYKLTAENEAPAKPEYSPQEEEYVPEGWTDEPSNVTEEYPYQWVSVRKRMGTVWYGWSQPVLWCKYSIDGSSYDDTEVRELIAQEEERLNTLIRNINTIIADKITSMIEDTEWMEEHFPEGVVSYDSGWNEDVEAYLQLVGIWARDGENNTTRAQWSVFRQQMNSLYLAVDELVRGDMSAEALQAAITATIVDGEAWASLETTYTKTDDVGKVMEWLYSALKSSTSPNLTWNDMISAASDPFSAGIADIRTQVQKLENGEYVAEADLEAKVDEYTTGLTSMASMDSAITTIFAKGLTTSGYEEGEEYYYLDNEGEAGAPGATSAWINNIDRDALQSGNYYSAAQLSPYLYKGQEGPDAEINFTAEEIRAINTFYVHTKSTEEPVSRSFYLEKTDAVKTAHEADAYIRVGITQDSAFIEAVAEQVHVATDELDVTTGDNRVLVNGSGIHTQNTSDEGTTWSDTNVINYTGSGSLASGHLTWDNNGILTVNASKQYGSGEFEYTEIKIGTDSTNTYSIKVDKSYNINTHSSISISPLNISFHNVEFTGASYANLNSSGIYFCDSFEQGYTTEYKQGEIVVGGSHSDPTFDITVGGNQVLASALVNGNIQMDLNGGVFSVAPDGVTIDGSMHIVINNRTYYFNLAHLIADGYIQEVPSSE